MVSDQVIVRVGGEGGQPARYRGRPCLIWLVFMSVCGGWGVDNLRDTEGDHTSYG